MGVQDNKMVDEKAFTDSPVEFVVSELTLLRFSLIFTIAYPVLLTIVFLLWFPASYLRQGLTFLWHLVLWLIPIVVVHEGLHAIVWALSGAKWRNIRFGFHRQYFTFYTHCKVPISKFTYFAGGIAPFVFLSILPAVYAFYIPSYYWLAFAIFNGWACAADLLMCYYVLLLPPKVHLLDHPEKLGFFIYSTQQKA